MINRSKFVPEFITTQTEPSLADKKAMASEFATQRKRDAQSAKYETIPNPARAEQDALMEAIANAQVSQPQQVNNDALSLYLARQQNQPDELAQMLMGRGNGVPMQDGVGSGNGRGQDMRVGDEAISKEAANDVSQPENKTAQSRLREVAGDDRKRISF